MAPSANTRKACLAMKKLGFKEKTVRPVLKRLLALYENNWLLIEDNDYLVLLEALFDSEKEKAQNDEMEKMDYLSEDDGEEKEPPLKRSKQNSQNNQFSQSLHSSAPNCSKQKMAKSTHCHGKAENSSSPLYPKETEQTNDIKSIFDAESDGYNYPIPLAHLENSEDESDSGQPFSEVKMITYKRGKHKVFSKERSDDALALEANVPEFGVPLAVIPPVSPRLLPKRNSHENYSNAKENCSTFPEVIDLDSDNTCTDPPLLLEDTSDTEGNKSEYMDHNLCEAEKTENMVKESMKLDIASSSRGDVGNCLMVISSPRSDFEGHTNEVSYLAISNGHQISLCSKSTVPNGPIRFQNLFKISTEIPRSIRSFHLDLSRCKIFLNMDSNCSNEMDKIGSASSSKTIMVQNQHYCNYMENITKGHEDYEISLINESNNDPLPKINYISKNVTYQNADTRSLLSRISKDDCCQKCFGDCLAAEIPCACAGKTGGEFAYTPCGLVKESFIDNCISMKQCGKKHNLFYCQECPLVRSTDMSLSGKCKGHLMRKFIKECWYKCGCSITCGNRVVQRGITVMLQVFMTPERKGWGLRTLEEIPKGTFICEYVGEVVTIKELSERNIQNTGNSQTYPVLLDANWSAEGGLKDEEALCIDATLYGNVARFINHRCSDANLVDIPVELESPDRHYYHVAFFTTRNVDAMEELTWDYGIEFNDHHPVKGFQCQCGSEFCRDRKATKRSMSDV